MYPPPKKMDSTHFRKQNRARETVSEHVPNCLKLLACGTFSIGPHFLGFRSHIFCCFCCFIFISCTDLWKEDFFPVWNMFLYPFTCLFLGIRSSLCPSFMLVALKHGMSSSFTESKARKPWCQLGGWEEEHKAWLDRVRTQSCQQLPGWVPAACLRLLPVLGHLETSLLQQALRVTGVLQSSQHSTNAILPDVSAFVLEKCS